MPGGRQARESGRYGLRGMRIGEAAYPGPGALQRCRACLASGVDGIALPGQEWCRVHAPPTPAPVARPGPVSAADAREPPLADGDEDRRVRPRIDDQVTQPASTEALAAAHASHGEPPVLTGDSETQPASPQHIHAVHAQYGMEDLSTVAVASGLAAAPPPMAPAEHNRSRRGRDLIVVPDPDGALPDAMTVEMDGSETQPVSTQQLHAMHANFERPLLHGTPRHAVSIEDIEATLRGINIVRIDGSHARLGISYRRQSDELKHRCQLGTAPRCTGPCTETPVQAVRAWF